MSVSTTRCDIVIVGAGSAGCVLAHRLSADQDREILLLEAGGPDNKEAVHQPPRFPELYRTAVDWDYHTTPQSNLHDRRLYHPRGKILGGSSSINGMIYIRGHPSDYDRWAEMGNDGWDYEHMLPYFKRAEHFVPGDGKYHGENGPLTVAQQVAPHPVSEAIVDGMVEAGIEYNPDFNGSQQEGCGFFHLTQRDGKRCSSAKAYIAPIMDRPNLNVETGAQVTRVQFENERAVGVKYKKNGSIREAYAHSEVILSAGSINSPQLLMLSGIGPADHLRKHDIDVQVNLPGVGKNLQDHLKVGVVYERTDGPLDPAPSSNVVETACFVRTDDDLSEPNLQFHNAPVYLFKHGLSEPPDDNQTYFTMIPTQIRPESTGEVRLASANPFDSPIINPQYLSVDSDIEPLVEGIKLAREIADTDALAPVSGLEIHPGPEVTTDTAMREYIRESATTVYHLAGTCRMGDEEMAVVDDTLRVRGVEGLRIVDASIMPCITAGNTNAPTIAIAEKAVDFITESGSITTDDCLE